MQTNARRLAARRRNGFTLIECSITLALAALLAGAAVPSFKSALERRQLDAASAQLTTSIHHTRSLAVARNTSVRMTFGSAAGASCYVIHTGSAADCRCSGDGAAVCRNGAEALQSVGFDRTLPVQLRSNSPSIVFDADKGTVTPTATLRLQARNGSAIHQIVNVMGRMRTCSPDGKVSGHRPC